MNQFENLNTSYLNSSLKEISEKCIECNLCVKQCAFLTKYGTPKKISDSWFSNSDDLVEMPFECSLCSLCTAVCPVDIDPKKMFIEMRRYIAASGKVDFTKQKQLINYEKRGTSRLFSFYGLPEGCDTVFFPGCALTGSRSQRVLQAYEHLQASFPNLGIVLDCCTKPSHDLGRTNFFNLMFSEMKNYLVARGVKNIITACPSCHAIFSKYADKLTSLSIYDILSDNEWRPELVDPNIQVTIQDSCVSRFNEDIQASARKLIMKSGLAFEEMKHHGKKTICCGEGGGANYVASNLAGKWGEIRRLEGKGKVIVTYCAGCANFLGRIGTTIHLLDLFFDPSGTLENKTPVTKSPMTYFKRLQLKRKFRKKQIYTTTRERIFVVHD